MKETVRRRAQVGVRPALLCALSMAVATGRAVAAPASHDQLADPNREHEEAARRAASLQAEDRARTGVALQVQSGVVWRSFSFEQDVYDRLRTLRSSLVVYRLDAALYPTLDWVPLQGNLGLIAGYEGTLTGSVHDHDFGKRYTIEHSELYGGLRLRRPVRRHTLGFDFTVGRLHSGLADGNNIAGVPDVSYTEARSSLDFSMAFDRLQTSAAVGLRVPLAYGEVASSDWFPRVEGYALDGSLRGSYRVSPRVSLELGTSLRRYVLEMNSEPEDASDGKAEVAGGAIDAYWAGYLGVSIAL